MILSANRITHLKNGAVPLYWPVCASEEPKKTFLSFTSFSKTRLTIFELFGGDNATFFCGG